MSLYLRVGAQAMTLGSATGFLVMSDDRPYLITNRHVVTGRDQFTHRPRHDSEATPEYIEIAHNVKGGLGLWCFHREDLYDRELQPRWLEHGTLGGRLDVIALPLTDLREVSYRPHLYRLDASDDLQMYVTDSVSIVGFPFGWTGGGFLPIWSRGTIASEPAIDRNDMPYFLVDSRSRPGQSGSPVIYFEPFRTRTTYEGSPVRGHGERYKLLGVYAGRISQESDLGYVFKARMIPEILAHGVRPQHEPRLSEAPGPPDWL